MRIDLFLSAVLGPLAARNPATGRRPLCARASGDWPLRVVSGRHGLQIEWRKRPPRLDGPPAC